MRKRNVALEHDVGQVMSIVITLLAIDILVLTLSLLTRRLPTQWQKTLCIIVINFVAACALASAIQIPFMMIEGFVHELKLGFLFGWTAVAIGGFAVTRVLGSSRWSIAGPCSLAAAIDLAHRSDRTATNMHPDRRYYSHRNAPLFVHIDDTSPGSQ